jgi:starch-binding outer membrane protein, SusD/RagB family
MKMKYILMLTILGAGILTGCSKDFLDSAPTEFVSSDQLNEQSKLDPSLLLGNIAGLYVTMYTPESGGTTGHFDFGHKGYDIFTDMLSSDMALTGLTYGWYGVIVRYQATVDYTRNETYAPWRFYYRLIFGANTVLDAQGGDSTTQTDETKRHIAGQAKAIRAFSYFYLTQLYAKGYSENEKILPIYRNTQVPNQPKSTTKEVYDLIVSDLRSAIDYLEDFERDSKEKIDQDVAEGLLAYVLAARGTNADLQEVITLTDGLLADYPLTTSAQAIGGFNSVTTPSWIWGVDLTLASNLDLVSWWGQVDYYTYSYSWAGDAKAIDRGLWTSIRADDVRKGQFSAGSGRPLNKFYDPAKVIGGQRNVTTDYVYMRADEMLLLNAEAKARLGQDDPARDALKELLQLRITDFSYVNALTGAALLNEIYYQTRVELWGEGKTYLALKRLKKSTTRGANHLFFVGQTVQWDDPKLTFVIPQAEVINNPVLNN